MDKQEQEQGKCEQGVYVVFEGFESRLLILGILFCSGSAASPGRLEDFFELSWAV